MTKHFKLWNRWRKKSADHWFTKLLVLFGVIQSPTFMNYECFGMALPQTETINVELDENVCDIIRIPYGCSAHKFNNGILLLRTMQALEDAEIITKETRKYYDQIRKN